MAFVRDSTWEHALPAPAASGKVRLGCVLKGLGKRAVGGLGIGLSTALGSCAGESVGILTYHRIVPWSGQGTPPTWNVTPQQLKAQLAGLLARGYRPRSLRDVLRAGALGQPLPRRSFVISFDDGYENVHRHAWPVLHDLGVPATVFLATAYLDRAAPFPFDDWAAAGWANVPAESWRPLTTAQCAEMLAGGLIDLGSHTHTHGVFRGRPEDLGQDLAASLAVLRTRFGLADATFSFPFGIAGPDLAAAARRAGVLCALTTQADLVRPGSDPFAWGRLPVEESDSVAAVAAKLDGWYSLARGAWLRLRGHRKEASA